MFDSFEDDLDYGTQNNDLHKNLTRMCRRLHHYTSTIPCDLASPDRVINVDAQQDIHDAVIPAYREDTISVDVSMIYNE